MGIEKRETKTKEKKALLHFKKSAEKGNGAAMAVYAYFLRSRYGCINRNELDVPWEPWAKKAFSSGNSFAIGYCHYQGLGTPYDDMMAFTHFEAAAENGDEYSQFMAGELLRSKRIRNDPNKAFYWYFKSAEQGFTLAQNALSLLYIEGKGCEKDEKKAKFWLKKAKNQGFVKKLKKKTYW